MLKKLFLIAAIAGASMFSLVACDKGNDVPSLFGEEPAIVDTPDEQVDADNEPTGAARAATPIDTANAYKIHFKVTTVCVSSTASVSYKYTEVDQFGTISGPMASTAMPSEDWKSFSVSRAKMNTDLYKTFDKTKKYVLYTKTSDAVKAVKAVKSSDGKTIVTPAQPAVPAQYKMILKINSNPTAEKAWNKAHTKRTGRPITTATSILDCHDEQ